jgi:hypothetical protein
LEISAAPSQRARPYKELPRTLAKLGRTSERPQLGQSVMRSFANEEFCNTVSWDRLQRILAGNGGSYGLHGSRGSGKTWLMRKAIVVAQSERGLGLWFPCPSEYNATSLLSALSDCLAAAVQLRIHRRRVCDIAAKVLGSSLIILGLTSVVVDLAFFTAHKHWKATSWPKLASVAFDVIPMSLRIAVGAAVIAGAIIWLFYFLFGGRARRRLYAEALGIRERIRFSASMMLASELSVDGGRFLTSAFKRSNQRTLNERPITIASLVFDLRNFAGMTAKTLRGPVVVGIDELDKIDSSDSVRDLLRNIKGIFDVEGITYLVSISDEAAAALNLGEVKSSRNEFHSSFYQIIELPPLDPESAAYLLERRGMRDSRKLAWLLCLLSGGNRREFLRMADMCAVYAREAKSSVDIAIVRRILEEQTLTLAVEIIKSPEASEVFALSEVVKYSAWTALPRQEFSSLQKFIRLGAGAIRDDSWNPRWGDGNWYAMQDVRHQPWRKHLIRLYLASSALDSENNPDAHRLLDDAAAIVDLRDIIITASYNAEVARSMLKDRFGVDFSGAYPSALKRDP